MKKIKIKIVENKEELGKELDEFELSYFKEKYFIVDSGFYHIIHYDVLFSQEEGTRAYTVQIDSDKWFTSDNLKTVYDKMVNYFNF